MLLGIDTLINNIGIGTFENLIVLLMIICHIVFFATSFRKAIVLLFALSGIIFIWFYEADYNYVKILIVFMMSFVLMALSLIATARESKRGIAG